MKHFFTYGACALQLLTMCPLVSMNSNLSQSARESEQKAEADLEQAVRNYLLRKKKPIILNPHAKPFVPSAHKVEPKK